MKAIIITLFLIINIYPAFSQHANVLFENVNLYDYEKGALSGPFNVLIEGNTIKIISRSKIPENGNNSLIIQGKGKTLIPGLIDVHVHLVFGS